MRQASRIYSKNKKQDKTSSIFRSTVDREGVQGYKKIRQVPGPGQYQVTFPLVKPKYEAIVKKNRSIIIKVNDTPNPGFNSRQPRFFRQYATVSNDQTDNNTTEFGLSREDKQHFAKPKNAYRYNFSLAKKDSLSSYSHFLHGKNHELLDDPENKIKGTNWSKYRQKRKIWTETSNKITAMQPGPGSYNTVVPQKTNKYFQENNSWQFRSSTRRSIAQMSKSYNFRLDVQDNTGGQEQYKSIHSRKNLLEPENI